MPIYLIEYKSPAGRWVFGGGPFVCYTARAAKAVFLALPQNAMFADTPIRATTRHATATLTPAQLAAATLANARWAKPDADHDQPREAGKLGGRPRSKGRRCPCGEMTARRAAARGHKCTAGPGRGD